MMIKLQLTRQENLDYFNVKAGTVASVDFETYVAAVVASEVGNSSLEVCKAQAVASRTFAVSKGVLSGKTITDTSSKDQAYRAGRTGSGLYPNAEQGTRETAGQILTYNGQPINAVYSASNGGRTVSSQERWGGVRPYLIAQDDPWDNAEKRTGHGVGMSQLGAKAMAAAGKDYREILAFYYPGTQIELYQEKERGESMPQTLTIYRRFLTNNDCYKAANQQDTRGVQVHSTGANNPWLKRYVQPDDGRLGNNPNGNSHNRSGGDVCASAYIGKLQDGTVAVYQALPWDYRCWLSGSGQNGNANRMGYKGFEICEDGLKDEDYFRDAVMGKAVLLSAYLCQMAGVSPYQVLAQFGGKQALAVMDHRELCAAGLASNHADITHWLQNFGLTMNDFRKAVQNVLDQGGVEVTYVDADDEGPMVEPAPDYMAYNNPVRYDDTMQAIVSNPRRLLNVHSIPAKTDESVIFQVEKGMRVDVLAQDGSWVQIKSGGRIGWVDGQYLVIQPKEKEPEPITEAKVEVRSSVITDLETILTGLSDLENLVADVLRRL